MTLKVTLVQGGGIGLDQVPAVKCVLSAAGVQIEWDEYLAGWASVERGGGSLPAEMLQSVRATGLALKTKLLPPPGAAPGPNRKEAGNFNVQFRRELGLFASVRPLKNLPGLSARFTGVDMLVIRELTEDLYTAIEHEIVPGVVQSIKVVTEAACRRFFRFAFEWSRRAGRKSVACVHKANILKLADGLFLESFRTTARDFPELQTRDLIVDNCCMQMVSRPQQFDVLVMGNLYGDLVSDLGAGVVGGVQRHGRHQRRRRRARLRIVPRRRPRLDRREPGQPAAAAAAGDRPAGRGRRQGDGAADRGRGRPGADGAALGDARSRRHGHDDGDGGGGRRGAGLTSR